MISLDSAGGGYIDEQKREKWSLISIIIGILAYLLLFIKTLVWTFMFGSFGFQTNLPLCIAAEGIAQPINLLDQMSTNPEIEEMISTSMAKQVNVTKRFRVLFRVLFF